MQCPRTACPCAPNTLAISLEADAHAQLDLKNQEAPKMSDTSFDGQRITAGTGLILSPTSPLSPASLFTPTPKAARRVLEFFTAQINNDPTRRAYLNAARRFAVPGARATASLSSPTCRPSTSPPSSRICRESSPRPPSSSTWPRCACSLTGW